MLIRHSIRRIFSILAIIMFCIMSFINPGFAAMDPMRTQQSDDPGVRVDYHSETGKLVFVGASPESPIEVQAAMDEGMSLDDRAMAVLGVYGEDFGLKNPTQELRLMRERTVDKDRSSVRYQQVFKGVPVIAGELVINQDSLGRLLSISGEISPDLSLSTSPTISSANAMSTALTAVAKYYNLSTSGFTATDPELWIFDERLLRPSERPATLVWRMDVSGVERLDIRELVLVDASLGVVALHFNQVDTALDREIYDNENDDTRGLPGTGPVRSEGDPASGIADVDDAYDFSGDTYNFYLAEHGRDSLDNAGMTLISTVRYCDPFYACPFANAFWNGNQMVYGQGYASADDVVGHELTHGVTDYESHLFYFYQSGAINEALSDIFGEFVDLDNGADLPADRWLMGEDLPIGAIRDMANPPAYYDPDRIGSGYYYCGTADNGGVHWNSGVANKAAYLLTDGDTFNGYVITGIGLSNTADLFYEVNTNLLTSGSNFNDLYNALIQASFNIGLGAGERQEVEDAVDATEMDIRPCGDPVEAPVCSGGLNPVHQFFDDLENTGSGKWVSAADVGVNEWYYPQNTHPYPFDATNTSSGIYNFWGYDQPITADFNIAMTSDVSLPANAYMHFKHYWDFESDFDGGVVEYSTNGGGSWIDAGSLFTENGYTAPIDTCCGNPLGGRQAFVYESRGYTSSRLDLNSLAGQDVRFRFRIGTDESVDDYGWFIDDVQIYTCSAGTELLKDTGFDVFVPNWWRGNRVTPVDGPDCTTSASGACSLKLEGNGQHKQVSFITATTGSAGDNFSFSLWNRASNSDRPFYTKVVLVYTDATEETFRLIPAKRTHGWEQYQLDFAASKDYNRVRVFLVYGHSSGKVWFDDISLTVGPMSTELVENGFFDVFVPNWWRGNRLTTSDGPDCSTSATGSCSMELQGNGTQKQVIFITPTSGSAGDNFTFSLWNRADNSERPFYTKTVLIYTDATEETFRLIPAKGTHDWARYQMDFTAAKDYNRIRVFLVYSYGSGTVWFDDVSLTVY